MTAPGARERLVHIANEIGAEALIADRPGQLDRLEGLAAQLRSLAQGQPEAEVAVEELGQFIAQEMRVLSGSSVASYHQRGEIVARNLATWARVTRRVT